MVQKRETVTDRMQTGVSQQFRFSAEVEMLGLVGAGDGCTREAAVKAAVFDIRSKAERVLSEYPAP